jgi:hypothetical protein
VAGYSGGFPRGLFVEGPFPALEVLARPSLRRASQKRTGSHPSHTRTDSNPEVHVHAVDSATDGADICRGSHRRHRSLSGGGPSEPAAAAVSFVGFQNELLRHCRPNCLQVDRGHSCRRFCGRAPLCATPHVYRGVARPHACETECQCGTVDRPIRRCGRYFQGWGRGGPLRRVRVIGRPPGRNGGSWLCCN